MANDVFTIMAIKNVSPFSHSQDHCHSDKGKKIDCQRRPYLQVEKEIRSNETSYTGPPCSVQQQNVI